MPIDTSSYPSPQPPASPLQTLSGVAGLQNTLNQNRLFQQQFQTNKAVSQIYKQAINPDGTIDQQKLTALLASDPNASYGLPQAYHLDTLESYVAPLAANPKATSGDVVAAMANAMTMGHADPGTIAQLYGSMPKGPDGKIDEAQVPGWIQQQQFRMLTMQQQFEALHPAPTMVNTGQAQIPMRLPAIGAPSLAGPGIQNELPPTTQRYNPQTRQMEFVGAGGASPGGSGMAPSGGGGLAAGPPMGASSAADVTAQGAAHQGLNLQSRADQVPQNKATLGNLEGALDQFTSGPGQDWKKVAKTFVNVNSPFGNVFDPKSIASQEEFNKQAVMLAQQQFQTLGGTGTDAKLESTSLTSPNSELSKLGNKGIIAMLKGNEDAISVKNQAWQQWTQSHGPETYGQFSTQFNKSYDPRVFQSQYLTPEDNKKMLSGMTASEKKSFANSYRTAIANGWVKLPGAQ